MQSSELTVSRFECPLFMRIEISEPNIVMHSIIDESISIDTNLNIDFLIGTFISLCVGHIILLHDFKSPEFFDSQQIIDILGKEPVTLVRSFLRSKIASSDLFVEPKTFRPGNSGRVR